MAKYTLEEIMYGDKYGIESAVFVEIYKMVERKVDAKTIREQLNMIYVKHAQSTRAFRCTTEYGTEKTKHLK